jgi:hypothetical protein
MWVKELANRTDVKLTFRGPFSGSEDYTTAAKFIDACLKK